MRERDEMNRRSFLKIGALAATAGTAAACGAVAQKVIPALIPADDGANPVEGRWFATSCMECGAGCGVVVRTVNGRAKKIEGNPSHPINRGKVCAIGQAAVRKVYHEERLDTPLYRKGGKGGQLAPVSWDEAVAILSEKLAAGGGKMFYLNGGQTDAMAGIARHIFGGMQGAVIATNHPPGREAHFAVKPIYTDFPAMPYPDIANSNFTLLFGADLFESDPSPVYFARVFGESRRGRPSSRGRFVYLGSRLSLTAASCDRWIPVPPGRLGLVALSIAQVMIDEVIDRNLAPTIPRNTLSHWAGALADYTPERVENRVEVTAEVIRRLARPFVEEAPAVAVAGDGMAGYTNAAGSLSAVSFINMVSYEIGREKLRVKPRRDPAPDSFLKSRMEESFGLPQNKQNFTKLTGLVEGMSSGGFNVGIISHTNPVFDTPQSLKFKEAMGKVGFTAVFASFMDDTAERADLVLPDLHWLEQWSAAMPEFAPGVPLLNTIQPVIVPFTGARNGADVLISAAKKAKLNAPAGSGEEYVKMVVGKFRPEMLEIPPNMTEAQSWNWLLQRGGWWPADEEAGAKPAPSTERLWELKDTLSLENPMFVETPNSPYHLHLYSTVSKGRGQGANVDWLQEMPDPITTLMWQQWVEINPVTAKSMGIKEGDMVTVTSSAGDITAPAFLYQGVRPDVIAIPIGFGHAGYGKIASGRGGNPMKLLAAEVDEKSGALAWRSQKVSVKKAGGAAAMLRNANPKGELHGDAFGV